MLNDVVVDTNVWMHAGTPKQKHFAPSLLFLAALLDSETKLCIDAKRQEADGSYVESKILGEYERKFRGSGGTGANVLAELIRLKRVRRVSLKTTEYARNWCDQHIGKKTDRPFLITAINSKSRTLVSHDEQDFSRAVRSDIKSEFNVDVNTADEATPRLE